MDHTLRLRSSQVAAWSHVHAAVKAPDPRNEVLHACHRRWHPMASVLIAGRARAAAVRAGAHGHASLVQRCYQAWLRVWNLTT